MCVCVSGKTQLYLLVVPDGNRRHFHLANIAGVWFLLWFCGCFVPIVKCFIQIWLYLHKTAYSRKLVFSAKDSRFFFIVNVNRQCYIFSESSHSDLRYDILIFQF